MSKDTRTSSTRRLLKVCLAILPILALVGCVADVDITVDLYKNENWQAVTEIALSAETIAMVGEKRFEQVLNESIAEAAQDNVEASWSKRVEKNAVVYSVKTKGKGLDRLARTAFGENAEIYVEQVDGKRIVHLTAWVDNSMGLSSQTITLQGGKIISGNGQLIGKDTMTWENPSGWIEATLTERSPVNVWLIVVIAVVLIVGVVVIAGAGMLLFLNRRKKIAASFAACPQCGFQLPPDAHHCPGCGRAL